jgi:hypothetical protein
VLFTVGLFTALYPIITFSEPAVVEPPALEPMNVFSNPVVLNPD